MCEMVDESSEMEENLLDIISGTLEEATLPQSTRTFFLSLLESGVFEERQTRGTISQWAPTLLKKLREDDGNEAR